MLSKRKNIGLIIFSRYNSIRFPGKALFKIEGRELLGHVLDRTKKIGCEFKIVVATSLQEDDDAIEKFAISENVEVFRGSQENVMFRAIECCNKFNFNSFARICGDRPLFCPNLARELISFHEENSTQLTTNIKKKTYPSGFTFEVIDVDALVKLKKENLQKEDLEHITSYFYRNPKDFKIYNFESSIKGISNLSCTVDYPKDIEKISKIMRNKTIDPVDLTLDDVIKRLKKYS